VRVVIALFVWLLFRDVRDRPAGGALERAFASLVALGIGIWIGVQAFINIGVNMGVLPTKGLTLPLLSFGGSGIVANCIAVAILLRVDYENRACCGGSGMSPSAAPPPQAAQPLGGDARARFGGCLGTVMITAGGTGGHVFPGSPSRRSSSRADGACSGSARATAWRARSCASTASSSRASPSAASRQGSHDRRRGAVRARRRVHAQPQDHPPPRAGRRAGFRRIRVGPGRARRHHDREASRTARRERNRRACQSSAGVRREEVLLGFPDAMRGRHASKVEWVGNPISEAIVRVPAPEARFAGRTGRCRC
jgi:hypothetical protein